MLKWERGSPRAARRLSYSPAAVPSSSSSSIAGCTHSCGSFELPLLAEDHTVGNDAINDVTYASLLRCCGEGEKTAPLLLFHGRRLHRHMARNRRAHQSSYLGNLLVQMYGSCGSLAESRAVFKEIHSPDRHSWNFMIASCCRNGHPKEALALYDHMLFDPDKCTFLATLSASGSLRSPPNGKRIHGRIVSVGESDVILETAIITMYGKCGHVADARAVFDRIIHRDRVSWTAMISAYAVNREGKHAIELFRQMKSVGVNPDRITFLCLLSAGTSLKCLETARVIHDCIASTGIEMGIAAENALLNMYGKCGSLDDAQIVFSQMRQRDIISWNSMLTAFVENEHYEEALGLFRLMISKGVKLDKITFVCTLDACASLQSLETGKQIHEWIRLSGLESDFIVKTALIGMYGKCGHLELAQSIFDGTCYPRRDIIMWSAMLAAYAHNGHGQEAMELFQKMRLEGVVPNKVTFLSLLNASASLACLDNGRAIHEFILTSGIELDVVLKNSLINMYGKCHGLEEAESIFYQMHERDLVSWNAMLAAYVESGHNTEAVNLFKEMSLERGVKPDKVTFLCLLNACANMQALEMGQDVCCCILESGLEYDVALKTALINMYGKCGSLKEARSLFDDVLHRDIIMWNTLLAAYARNGHGEETLTLFWQMVSEGIKPDKVTFLSLLHACGVMASLENGRILHIYILGSGIESDIALDTALLDMYGKCGSLVDALGIFEGMRVHDVVSWNAMIATIAQCGQSEDALKFSRRMNLEGVKPDKVTFLCLLNSCTSEASLERGKEIHECISSNGFEMDTNVRIGLLNMYGKCGSIKDAQSVFDGTTTQADIVMWNAMIAAYGHNGHGYEASKHFRQMEFVGVNLDKLTFICLLTACSHAGMRDEAWEHFIAMCNAYLVLPSHEHYVCLIDLVSRAGWLDEAEDMVQNIPLKIDTIAMANLFGAHRTHGNIRHELHLDIRSGAPYSFLTDIYSMVDTPSHIDCRS